MYSLVVIQAAGPSILIVNELGYKVRLIKVALETIQGDNF